MNNTNNKQTFLNWKNFIGLTIIANYNVYGNHSKKDLREITIASVTSLSIKIKHSMNQRIEWLPLKQFVIEYKYVETLTESAIAKLINDCSPAKLQQELSALRQKIKSVEDVNYFHASKCTSHAYDKGISTGLKIALSILKETDNFIS
jgi:hypothetical protein